MNRFSRITAGLLAAALALSLAPASAGSARVSLGVVQSEGGTSGLALRWTGAPSERGWSYVAEASHSEDGESWIGAGLGWTWRSAAAQPWFVRLAVMPGLYEAGDGRDLGGRVEFSSSLELGWELPNRSQISLMVTHLSNAGIYERNPGVNALRLGWSLPLGRN